MMNFTTEQTEAINKEGTNIIVSAGAGSGKTAVLSERVLRKVKSGIDIRNILILTFTNEAAGEMKNRIRKKLEKAGLKEQLEYIDAAYITTFDAYALSIVKKYHTYLNINRDIKIKGQDRFTPIVAEREYSTVVKKGEELNYNINYNLPNKLISSVQGEIVGNAEIVINGVVVERINLLATATHNEATIWDYIKEIARN